MSLGGLVNGVFEAVDLEAGSDQNFIVVGDLATNGICTNVVFTDMVAKGVVSSKFGVEFRYAVNCGWSRGSISGGSGSKAARIASQAVACYIEGANLAGIPAEPKIDVPSPTGHRIADNYNSNQRTPLGFGVKSSATMSGASLTVTSSYVEVSASGASPANLDIVNGGQEGDVLVLRKAPASPTVTLRKGFGGNLALASNAGSFALNNSDDTITLIKVSPANWLELSHSNNA